MPHNQGEMVVQNLFLLLVIGHPTSIILDAMNVVFPSLCVHPQMKEHGVGITLFNV
jgi:hypothetical protein